MPDNTTLPSNTAPPTSASASTAAQPPSSSSSQQTLSPLEKEVLEEYALLLSNLNKISAALAELSEKPTLAILDSLRVLERKTSLVSTLLKASVYSIVLQQEAYNEGEREGGG
ncbi:hypothetical protein MMC14_009550 [Varicellaria rhodocarpa]|nr:hypothetical protein [Varicellaria rhodocarpa]